MRATSLCLMRSWSRCGRLPTTAIAVATSPPLWSSKMLTQESQSSSGQCLILKGSSHLGQQHLISCKIMKSKTFSCCFFFSAKTPRRVATALVSLYDFCSVNIKYLQCQLLLIPPCVHLKPCICSLNRKPFTSIWKFARSYMLST